jgi:hypothetical protein
LAVARHMILAFADPPYLGNCKKYEHYHPDGLCWDDLDTHRRLIDRLEADYPDGWAMCGTSVSLRHLLPLCPPDARVAPWVKTFCAFKRGVRPAYAWEPVIFRGGHNPPAESHPPTQRWRADHTEGLVRRSDHSQEGPHRRQVGGVLRLGAGPLERQGRRRCGRSVPRNGDDGGANSAQVGGRIDRPEPVSGGRPMVTKSLTRASVLQRPDQPVRGRSCDRRTHPGPAWTHTGVRARRMTQREWQAIDAALAAALASEVIDGYEGEDDEELVRSSMVTAQQKVWDRIR